MEFSKPLRLLLACLGQDAGQVAAWQGEAISPEDWQAFAILSRDLWVTPQIYRLFEHRLVSFEIPPHTYHFLHEIYFDNLKRSLRLHESVRHILRLLAQRDIPVIPLKGVYLAEKVYGNIGLRPMHDVDLLVRRADLFKARAALEEMGYTWDHSIDLEREFAIMNHLPRLEKPGAPPVELHWTLLRPITPFTVDIDAVWQAARPGTLEGLPIYELAPEDLLLHVAINAAYANCFSYRLRPIYDLAGILQVFGACLDWPRLAQQAHAWGAERSLYLALRVTQRLLGAALPAGFLERLRPADGAAELEEWAIQQVFHPLQVGSKLAAAYQSRSWVQRLWRIGRALFPAPDEMRANYPALAHGVGWLAAYVQNLRHVIRRNRQNVVKLLRRDPHEIADLLQMEQNEKLLAWQSGNER